MLCYNRLYLSKKCLESYLDTISVPYELFIVNNASTDRTKEWLDTIKNDKRIKEIIHTERNDPAAALNLALEKCSGKYLHVMENDYIYFRGWIEYAIERFEKIPDLGQLCICTGPEKLIGPYYKNLIYLSLANVVSSSIFRSEIFFRHNIRWENCCGGYLPNDGAFSAAIKKAGFLVAWPDKPLANALGFSDEEMANDPDYYIRKYRSILFSSLKPRNILRRIIKLKFCDPILSDAILKLYKLYRVKLIKMIYIVF